MVSNIFVVRFILQEFILPSSHRASSNSITLFRAPSNSQARDAQQSRHEIPRTYEPYRTKEDTALEDVYLPEIVNSRQVNSSSGGMDEFSHIHYAVHSTLLTNTLGNFQHALGHEQRQSYPPLFVDCKLGTPHFRIGWLEERTSGTNLLQRWVYETSNANITFAERLEKSNWEGARMQKL
jgi:hypothetical protein